MLIWYIRTLRKEGAMTKITDAKTTKTTTFGELSVGQEFLTENNKKNMVVLDPRHGGSRPAVYLEGRYRGELWFPIDGYEVRVVVDS